MTSFANATVLAAVIALCLNAEKEPRSPLFTNSWQTIRQALDQFEADVKIEALPFGFDDEDHDHFTFTQAAWFAAHVDEEGDPMPRPQYDAPGVFPAETAAQNVWNKNANQYYAFRNYTAWEKWKSNAGDKINGRRFCQNIADSLGAPT